MIDEDEIKHNWDHWCQWMADKLMNHSGKGDVTYGYYIGDIEALRESVQMITDEILNQANNSKYDKAS